MPPLCKECRLSLQDRVEFDVHEQFITGARVGVWYCKTSQKYQTSCSYERQFGACGPEGKNFQRKG